MPKFQNPAVLNYKGIFFLELLPGTDLYRLPQEEWDRCKEAYSDTDIVELQGTGSVRTRPKGIQMCSYGDEFFFNYEEIRIIRDVNSDPMWINPKFSEEITE